MRQVARVRITRHPEVEPASGGSDHSACEVRLSESGRWFLVTKGIRICLQFKPLHHRHTVSSSWP
jgi:hypothetical protein